MKQIKIDDWTFHLYESGIKGFYITDVDLSLIQIIRHNDDDFKDWTKVELICADPIFTKTTSFIVEFKLSEKTAFEIGAKLMMEFYKYHFTTKKEEIKISDSKISIAKREYLNWKNEYKNGDLLYWYDIRRVK